MEGCLEGDELAAYKTDLVTFHNKGLTDEGLDLQRGYLLAMGVRK